MDQPLALVVMLHGRFGSASQAEDYYGWNDAADAGGFVVAYPNGTDWAWNAGGGCCREPGREDHDDVGFIVDMIDLIGSRLPVDPDRVFATGMSNGGKMAFRLACETDRFAAVAPVAGLQLVPCNSPKPTSILVIHGLDDDSAPFNGGPNAGSSNIDVPSIPAVIARWRTVNDCGNSPTEAVNDDVTDSFSACANGRAVELLAVANMKHVWPGSGRGPIERLFADYRGGDDINATQVIWQFFDSYPRPSE